MKVSQTISTDRGHEILEDQGEYTYLDTGESTIGNPRNCGRCNNPETAEGHDACLGTLPGVMNACCGHGDDKSAYVQFPDSTCIRGEKALDYMRRISG